MQKFKKIVIIIGLIIFQKTYTSWESEWETMQFAQRCREQGIYGFEGCKNKKECGFNGFYLAKYSREGLCDRCEFKQYPERFVACLFCRMPRPKITDSYASLSCLMCSSPIKKLLIKKLKTTTEDYDSTLSMGAYSCLEASSTISRKNIPAFIEFKTRDTVFKNDGPHIYRGAVRLSNGNKLHIWVNDVDITENEKRKTTWEEAENYVSSIAHKYNIFGPETGELITEMPPNISATYEERVPVLQRWLFYLSNKLNIFRLPSR